MGLRCNGSKNAMTFAMFLALFAIFAEKLRWLQRLCGEISMVHSRLRDEEVRLLRDSFVASSLRVCDGVTSILFRPCQALGE